MTFVNIFGQHSGGGVPLRPKILSVSCSFLFGTFGKIVMLAPPHRVGTPSYVGYPGSALLAKLKTREFENWRWRKNKWTRYPTMDKWFLDPEHEFLKCASTDKFVWFFYEKVVTEKSVTGIKLPLVRIFRTKHTLPKI